MIRHMTLLLPVCLMLTCFVVPMQAQSATTNCTYNFSSGTGDSYLSYCVTVNGNIPMIVMSADPNSQVGPDGEGYGVCNENPAQNYTDYGASDTGNWNPAILVSRTTTSVKIARTTSDGHWTLTQTITTVPTPPSIKVVMALRNNQPAAHVAYLVRFVQDNGDFLSATLNSAFAWHIPTGTGFPYGGIGFQLQNVGNPSFGFWQAYIQTVPTGPNACAFAFNANPNSGCVSGSSMEIAYVGPVPAGRTKTVTLVYRSM